MSLTIMDTLPDLATTSYVVRLFVWANMLVAWSRKNRRRQRWETPSVPLFRGKKCEASLSLAEGKRLMSDG